ncbi:hypothetical protein HDU82_003957 [Entophlyctis luteolus]|nr:hypothetical protein HDU82_003957 [Entophlyctis luteolus]KAJ3382015.1 hypothetical protein HDU84_004708 [Entophlyctis sp. JEL0112]
MAERIITASPTNSDFDNEATLQPGVARVIFAEPEEDDCDDLDVGFSHSLPHPPPQEPTPPVPTSSMVTFKIEHIGITKKVALPSLSSWTLAKEKICEAMRLNPDSVSFCKYADEDGDFITIDSDADLRAFAAMPSLPTLTVVTFSEQQEEQKHRQKPSPQALVVIDMLADLVQSNPDALSSAMVSLDEARIF